MAATSTSRRRVPSVALPRVDTRMVVGLALALIAFAAAYSFLSTSRDTAAIVVAARDMPAGHAITAGDLTTADVRLNGDLASLSVQSTDLDQLIGRTVSRPVTAGEMVVRPALAGGPLIGANDVALTVPVQADAVYARLRPGDRVAVLATRDKGKPDSQTQTLLDRAIVYDVAAEARRVIVGSDGRREEGILSNVTLVVPRSQAERVAHAVVNWQLTLVLLGKEEGNGG